MTVPFITSLFIFTSLVFVGLYFFPVRQNKIKRQSKKYDYSKLVLTYLELLKCNLYIDTNPEFAHHHTSSHIRSLSLPADYIHNLSRTLSDFLRLYSGKNMPALSILANIVDFQAKNGGKISPCLSLVIEKVKTEQKVFSTFKRKTDQIMLQGKIFFFLPLLLSVIGFISEPSIFTSFYQTSWAILLIVLFLASQIAVYFYIQRLINQCLHPSVNINIEKLSYSILSMMVRLSAGQSVLKAFSSITLPQSSTDPDYSIFLGAFNQLVSTSIEQGCCIMNPLKELLKTLSEHCSENQYRLTNLAPIKLTFFQIIIVLPCIITSITAPFLFQLISLIG